MARRHVWKANAVSVLFLVLISTRGEVEMRVLMLSVESRAMLVFYIKNTRKRRKRKGPVCTE